MFSSTVHLRVLLECVKCFLITKETGVGVLGRIGGRLVHVLEVAEKGLKLYSEKDPVPTQHPVVANPAAACQLNIR